MNVDFNAVCRICLREGVLKSIFKIKRQIESTQISCSEMILACATVSVQENDGMPASICSKCMSKLKTAYGFRKLCEKSYHLLTSLATAQGKASEDDVVKNEIPDSPELHEEFSETIGVPLKLEDSKEPLLVKEEVDEKFDDVLTSLNQVSEIDILNQNVCNEDDNNDDAFLPSDDENLFTLKARKNVKKGKKRKGRKDKCEEKKKSVEKAEELKGILGFDVNTLKTKDGFDCHLCKRVIKVKRHFVQHLQQHLGIKTFFCQICQKYFSREYEHMKRHSDDGRNEKFYCKPCDKYFCHRGSLNVHLRTHSNEKPHICDDCGKAFGSIVRLNVHKVKHTGKKEFMCQYCSKDFYWEKSLIVHIKYKHTNDRKFKCDTCDKKFVTSESLRMHQRRHLGIKMYPCNFCDKSFVTTSARSTHHKMHSKVKPHACRVCKTMFGRTDHRNRHEMTAHGMDFREGKRKEVTLQQ